MEEMELMMHLHLDNERQGPGSNEMTELVLELAFKLAGFDNSRSCRTADIGCGTGAQTITLAKSLKGEITAVDIFSGFLEKLQQRIQTEKESLTASVSCIEASMDNLPFKQEEFDIIWSEGAIYNIGFRKGLEYWKQFLKKGGILAVSEITWTTDRRPSELEEFWNGAYSEMDTASGKIKALEEAGYRILGHLMLPENCWTDKYYKPLLESHGPFLARFAGNGTAAGIVAADIREADMYNRYKNFYSYGFYIARKI